MRRNEAGQRTGAQMNSATDGSPITAGVTCQVRVDGAAFAACTANHVVGGYWEALPTQAQTDGEVTAFQFSGGGAVAQTVIHETTSHATGVPVTQDLNNFDPAADPVATVTDITNPVPVDSRLRSAYETTVPISVTSATDGATFIISGPNGNLAGAALLFSDTQVANANRGERRVILSHNTGTGEVQVGFADESAGSGTGFTNTPNAGDLGVVV